MRKSTWAIIGITCLFNIALWSVFNRPESPEPGWQGMFNYVSFSPYQKDQDPIENKFPAPEEIWDDLNFLKGKTKGIRTYSSLDGMEVIPGMATRLGYEVTAGAWLDGRYERNEDEIYNLIANAQRYPATIKRVIVGNEAVYRGDLSVQEMIGYLDRVRAALRVPVGTAEPWHVFVKNPELVKHVDFIAIHVLPYWEKVPFNDAIGWVFDRYKQVKEAFPGKPVFLAEVGWPSNGENYGKAKPGREAEARFLRRFLNVADQRGIDYCIMEVFDQPWKKPHEGVVGAFWGIYDVERKPKFTFQGPILDSSMWYYEIAAVLTGLLFVGFYLRRKPAQPFSGKLFFALLLQTTASVFVWVMVSPLLGEFLFWETFIWAILLPMQVGLLMIILVNGFEMSEMIWTEGLKRRFQPLSPPAGVAPPRVSIHVPICKEPPDMVIDTLNGLAALDYANYEVLVIDNNNPHPELWQPVEAHCAALGGKFRFFHLETHPGYKAGALNFALEHTDPQAEFVAVVDSDYIVRTDWLATLVPHFERPEVGVVQAPQDHRGWEGNLFKEMINWEYHGFFEIGMVHRNERNAIIQHGTMTIIRKAMLLDVRQVGRVVHLRGCRARPADPEPGLGHRLCQGELRQGTHPGFVRRLQAPALPLGVRRGSDHEAPLAGSIPVQPQERLEPGATLPLHRRLAALVRGCHQLHHERALHPLGGRHVVFSEVLWLAALRADAAAHRGIHVQTAAFSVAVHGAGAVHLQATARRGAGRPVADPHHRHRHPERPVDLQQAVPAHAEVRKQERGGQGPDDGPQRGPDDAGAGHGGGDPAQLRQRPDRGAAGVGGAPADPGAALCGVRIAVALQRDARGVAAAGSGQSVAAATGLRFKPVTDQDSGCIDES